MCKPNADIRRMLFENDIKHYALAKRLNISEVTFCRWLRDELPPKKKQEIIDAINELANR